MQPCGRLLRLGAGLPPAPTAPSLPCLHSGGLADGRKHACGEELSSLSLPFSFSFFHVRGSGDRYQAHTISSFPPSLPAHSPAGAIGGACPVLIKMIAICLGDGFIWQIGAGFSLALRKSAGSKQREWGRRGRKSHTPFFVDCRCFLIGKNS